MQNNLAPETSVSFPAVIYRPPCSEAKYELQLSENACLVHSSTAEVFTLEFKITENRISLHCRSSQARPESLGYLVGIEHLLGQYSEVTEIVLLSSDPVLEQTLESFKTEGGAYFLLRSEFYQLPFLWLAKKPSHVLTERWTESHGRSHPVRPKPFDGTAYSRLFPQIQKTLSFRRVDLSRDLDLFHNWHNQARVSEFWELNQSKEQLREYLNKQLNDAHQSPWIVEADGKPVAYFELYYTPEDRLGPYYDYEAHDRGFHFLIGDRSFLGLKNTDAVIKSALHFLFLDDPRTRNVMAEPRSDNTKILRYVEVFPAWKKLKEFDFPHKRAALLECRRERFFQGTHL
ncbi:MAG: N-acetyltransferase, partial [Proteobacteria bacterium]